TGLERLFVRSPSTGSAGLHSIVPTGLKIRRTDQCPARRSRTRCAPSIIPAHLSWLQEPLFEYLPDRRCFPRMLRQKRLRFSEAHAAGEAAQRAGDAFGGACAENSGDPEGIRRAV